MPRETLPVVLYTKVRGPAGYQRDPLPSYEPFFNPDLSLNLHPVQKDGVTSWGISSAGQSACMACKRSPVRLRYSPQKAAHKAAFLLPWHYRARSSNDFANS